MKIALFYHFTALPKEPSRISLTYLIFLETRIIDLHFPAGSLCLSSFKYSDGCHNFREDFSISKRRAFRTFKVIDIGGNWKHICNFLLVHNSNFGPILHRVRAEIHFMCSCSWPHPYSTLILGVPIEPDRPCWASASAWALSYLAVKLFLKNSNVYEHGTLSLETDRRTDGRHAIS